MFLSNLFGRKNKRLKPRREGQEKSLDEILMTRDRERITGMVLEMGGVAFDMLRRSTSVLESGNDEDAYAVVAEDSTVDRLEMEIDRECFATAAMRQPIQDDLRYIFAVVKLTGDIERIGDESTNIARHLLHYRPCWNTPEDLGVIPSILEVVLDQLKNALDALKNSDLPLARKVFARDVEVDRMYDALYEDFLDNASGIESGLFLRKACVLALARHLERAGDHIANVAEYICFMITGERIATESDPSKDYLNDCWRNPERD